MEEKVGTNHRVRFKEFELDPHTRELYRNGIRLRVQGQPIDVLEMPMATSVEAFEPDWCAAGKEMSCAGQEAIETAPLG